MIEKREPEWAELQSRAIHLLEHPEEIAPEVRIRRMLPRLRVWHYPAFDQYKSWTTFWPTARHANQEHLIALEVSWDRPADWQRLSDPLVGSKLGFGTMPSMKVRTTQVLRARLERVLDAARHLVIPVVIRDDNIGLDGEAYGLEIDNFSPRIRLQWWCQGPDQWKEFLDWFIQLNNFLKGCFDPDG